MSSKTDLTRRYSRWLATALLPFVLVVLWWLHDSLAYVQTTHNGVGLFWADSTVTLNLRLGCPPNGNLPVYGPCWDDAAKDAAERWNAIGAEFTFHIQSPSQPAEPTCSGANVDRVNTVVWADTQCGMAFGDATLAITGNWFSSAGELADSDVLFNTAHSWSTYSGPRRFGVVDFHRVALHEFGHVLGLDHPDEYGQFVNAIMNSKVSNADRLQADDIAGIQAIYDDSGGSHDDDHGNTRQEATVVSLPSDTRGTLEETGDEDYFRLSIPHSGILTVETTGSTDTSGTLYEAEGRWLDSDYDSGSGDNFHIRREVSAGMYYVRVRGFLTTGSYTLHVRFTVSDGSSDDHGDTRQEATRVSLPSDTQGTLEKRGDEDYFRLSVPDSGTLTVETTGSTDTSGTLHTADGGWLDSMIREERTIFGSAVKFRQGHIMCVCAGF